MKKRVTNRRNKSLAIVRHFFPKVKRVVDASTPVIIEVTLKDIADANVKNHTTCALAIACKRAFKADGVIIGLTTSYMIVGDTATRYSNADTVSREITSFDRKAGFDAGFYHLTPSSPSRHFGVRKEYRTRRIGKPSGGYKEVKKLRHFTSGVRTTLGQRVGIA